MTNVCLFGSTSAMMVTNDFGPLKRLDPVIGMRVQVRTHEKLARFFMFCFRGVGCPSTGDGEPGALSIVLTVVCKGRWQDVLCCGGVEELRFLLCVGEVRRSCKQKEREGLMAQNCGKRTCNAKVTSNANLNMSRI